MDTPLRARYTWMINQQTLGAMKNAKPKQKFVSQPFKTAKLRWELHAYPNGHSKNDYHQPCDFQLFLKLLSVPAQTIIVTRTIICNETQSSHTFCTKYNTNKSTGWPNHTMKLSEIQHLSSLSFTINMKVIRILSPKNNHIRYQIPIKFPQHNKFKWRIPSKLLEMMKKSHTGKSFESPIYNNSFCLRIHPNDTRSVRISLQLCCLPTNETKLKLNWKINLKGTISKWNGEYTVNVDSEWVNEFSYNGDMVWSWGTNKCKFDKFKEFKDVVISAEISIKPDSSNDDIIPNLMRRWTSIFQSDDKKERVDGHKHEQRLNVMEKQLKLMAMQLEQINNEQQRHITDSMTELIEVKEQMAVIATEIKQDKEEDDEKQEEVVRKWLRDTVRLPQYYQIFIDQGFDEFESICDITVDNLEKMGIEKIGHQNKIIKYARKLNESPQEISTEAHVKSGFLENLW